MKLFLRYLSGKRKAFLLFAAFALIFALAFWLYRLPLAAVLYPAMLCAAVGMIALFCGVTNCPLASLFISAELFGLDCVPYCLLVIAVSYLLSGYYGLYRTQRFYYSKFANEQIHHKTR